MRGGSPDGISNASRTRGQIVTDVNGKQCLARLKDMYWLFYQDCCSPASLFGDPGDKITTNFSLVTENNGVCRVDPVRPDQTEPEEFPSEDAGSCL